jgi:hypothetical protein
MLRQDNRPIKPISTTLFSASTSLTTTAPVVNQHTILLVQISQAKDSRTYLDYNTPEQAVLGAISLYEDRLRQFNPLQTNIKYTVEDLFEFFDGLGELACLVFDPILDAYQPKPPEYIKQKALVYLQRSTSKKQ